MNAYRQPTFDADQHEMQARIFPPRPGDYVFLSGTLPLAYCLGTGHANEGYELPRVCLEPGCFAQLPQGVFE